MVKIQKSFPVQAWHICLQCCCGPPTQGVFAGVPSVGKKTFSINNFISGVFIRRYTFARLFGCTSSGCCMVLLVLPRYVSHHQSCNIEIMLRTLLVERGIRYLAMIIAFYENLRAYFNI
jgi:hypothetical protein